jgi:hypothetical protein
VFHDDENIAVKGTATQSSTAFDGPPQLAIDGNTNGDYNAAKSTTHTQESADPWWEVDLGAQHDIARIAVWNRTDNSVQSRLAGCKITLLDDQRSIVWEQSLAEAPELSTELAVGGPQPIRLASASADYAYKEHEAAKILDDASPDVTGWSVSEQIDRPHTLVLIPAAPHELPAGAELSVTIEQRFTSPQYTLARFRLSTTADPRASALAALPAEIAAIIRTPDAGRNDTQRAQLAAHYRSIAPLLAAQRDELAAVRKQLAEFMPYTTVPVMRELPESGRRTTLLQLRGNYQQTSGSDLAPGVPAAFHPLPDGAPTDRLALARWLVDRRNPLTARVMSTASGKLFGDGLVPHQRRIRLAGDQPTHPELDWLAVNSWTAVGTSRRCPTARDVRDISAVVAVTRVLERDSENVLLARGPRVRLTAETIRDQARRRRTAEFKPAGPPVRPPQPSIGLSAAFGSGIDWQTSDGEDRYRRGLYTTWRRSNPYPSMATFDAPNREVCTLRRARTNTPLQALVTLNDPVFVEAAQGLARRMLAHEGEAAEKAAYGFRVCLSRPANETELARLAALFDAARADLAATPDRAAALAASSTVPPAAAAAPDPVELAAWTVVGNVLLNLDEMFMKR